MTANLTALQTEFEKENITNVYDSQIDAVIGELFKRYPFLQQHVTKSILQSRINDYFNTHPENINSIKLFDQHNPFKKQCVLSLLLKIAIA